MLRTRSGEPTERSSVNATALAEMGQFVASAQDEINRLVQLGELQDDPIRYPIQALSVHLDALYKVTRAGSEALAEQIQRSDASTLPLRDDDLPRAVVRGTSGQAANAVPALQWRSMLIGAGLLFATLMIGGGTGYWFHGATPALVGVHAGAERCEDRPDGSRLCWIPVFERLPPTAGQRG